jgi:PHD/YefM family antitoxin component YafN of YafNO toxin-antitoxin module
VKFNYIKRRREELQEWNLTQRLKDRDGAGYSSKFKYNRGRIKLAIDLRTVPGAVAALMTLISLVGRGHMQKIDMKGEGNTANKYIVGQEQGHQESDFDPPSGNSEAPIQHH